MDQRLEVHLSPLSVQVEVMSDLPPNVQELGPKHPHTLFLRTSVANVPFLVAKMSVQVLPCVMVFVDSRCVDR